MRPRVRLALARFLILDSAYILSIRARNGLRRALGRNTQAWDATGLTMLAGHFFGTRRIKAVARGDTPTDGAGFQVFLTIAAMAFADLIGAGYVHLPFSEIKHADRPMPAYSASWNAMFDPGSGEGEPQERAVQFIDLYNYENFTRIFLPLLYREIARQRERFKALRRASQSGTKAAPPEPRLEVAVHFREGDIGPDRNHFMWIAPEIVRRSLIGVTRILDEIAVPYSVTIVGQETSEHLRAIDYAFDRELINADTIRSFTALESADIVIMAKSYFSYMSAYFSDAVCIFRPWGRILGPHFPVPLPQEDWLASAPDGGFDEAAFLARLGPVLRRKGIAQS